MRMIRRPKKLQKIARRDNIKELPSEEIVVTSTQLPSNFDPYIENVFSLYKSSTVFSIMVNGGAAIALFNSTEREKYIDSIGCFSFGVFLSFVLLYFFYANVFSYFRIIKKKVVYNKDIDINKEYLIKMHSCSNICAISLGISVLFFQAGLIWAVVVSGTDSIKPFSYIYKGLSGAFYTIFH